FQAEDGIRDDLVTGVQTCALPICRSQGDAIRENLCVRFAGRSGYPLAVVITRSIAASRFSIFTGLTRCSENPASILFSTSPFIRSEERRVGKECRSCQDAR